MTVKSRFGDYSIQFLEPSEVFSGHTKDIFVFTDENVASHYQKLLAAFENVKVVAAGETSKSVDVYSQCLSWLALAGAKRDSVIIAFGGGVVGDLAGFVASTYMRGIKFIMVPTSLLAMVDSSIGGKVGIDLPEGENMVGAFWPPVEVRLSTVFLSTLPKREWLSGAAEVWKYGAILDAELFELLEAHSIKETSEMRPLVQRCLELKLEVVQQDELETSGLRAILNFGHTVGHAIETALGYGVWTHGEAIAAGMVIEAEIGETLGLTRPSTAQRLRSGLDAQGLPTELPEGLSSDDLVSLMKKDKKALAGGMSFSLLETIGRCKLVNSVPEEIVRSALLKNENS